MSLTNKHNACGRLAVLAKVPKEYVLCIFAISVDNKPDMLLGELGMEMNDEKNRYYMLLDELF